MNNEKNDLEKQLEELKNNPVFQMSLSAKELFHSNMLAMFLQQELSTDLRNKIKDFFPPKNANNYEVLDVLREHKKLDLIIIYANKDNIDKNNNWDFNSIEKYFSTENTQNDDDILDELKKLLENLQYVVIENKFKSIPTKEQLERYAKEKLGKPKSIKIFSKGEKLSAKNTTCYLFAPEKSLNIFFNTERENDNEKEWKKEFGEIEWQGKSYEKYIQKIQKSKISDDFLKKFIEYYYEFVKKMLDIYETEILKERFGFDKGKAFLSSDQDKKFKKIRIQDFYEKLSCNYLLYKLNKDLQLEENYNKNKENKELFSKSDYSRGQGLVEIGFIWKETCFSTYLGIQDGSLRIYVMASNQKDEKKKAIEESKDEKDKEEKTKYYENVERQFNKINYTKKDEKKIAEINKTAKSFINNISEEAKLKNDGNPYGYKKDNYICKYGKIDLNKYVNEEKEYWRDISYDTLKDKVKKYLDALSELNPEKYFKDILENK